MSELVERLAKKWSRIPKIYEADPNGQFARCSRDEAFWWLRGIADDPDCPPKVARWLRTQAEDGEA